MTGWNETIQKMLDKSADAECDKDARIAELTRQLETTMYALRYYADSLRYSAVNLRNPGNDPYTPAEAPYYRNIGRDYGNIARAAIASVEGKSK